MGEMNKTVKKVLKTLGILLIVALVIGFFGFLIYSAVQEDAKNDAMKMRIAEYYENGQYVEAIQEYEKLRSSGSMGSGTKESAIADLYYTKSLEKLQNQVDDLNKKLRQEKLNYCPNCGAKLEG